MSYDHNIERPYTAAIEMISANEPEEDILKACKISRPELDLIKRLVIFSQPNLRIDTNFQGFKK